MKKRIWSKIFAFLILAALTCVVFAACTPPAPPPVDPVDPPPVTPVDPTPTYLAELGTILANTTAMNPSDGFLMDLGANVAWNFTSEEKKQYNWSYGLTVKGNLFVDGALKQGLAIELRDNSKEEKPLIFGLYNDAEENLYIQVGTSKFHFDNVAISTAIKTILVANGVNLDFDINDVQIPGLGNVGDVAETLFSLMASVFDSVTKTDTNYTVSFTYTKMYTFINGLLGMVSPGNSLDTLIPESIKQYLPKEMTFKAVIRTANNLLVGVDLIDSVMTTKDAANDGTFNMTSNFTLFGAPADTLNVGEMVNADLKAVEATKILNVNTHGNIVMTKAGEAVRNFSWKLVANMDLFRMVEKNFVLEDEAFTDNFLHFQVAMESDPILDVAYAPHSMGASYLYLDINIETILNTLFGEGEMIPMILTMMLAPNFILPIDSSALGALLAGKVNPIDDGSVAELASDNKNAAIGGLDIDGIIKTITDLLALVTSHPDGAQLDIAGLLKMIALPESIAPYIEKLTNGADTALLRDNVFEFANAATAVTENYNTKTALLQGKPDGSGGFEERPYVGIRGTGSAINDIEFLLSEGFLSVKSLNSAGEWTSNYDGAKEPISVKELNGFVKNASMGIQFTGNDILDNQVSTGGGSADMPLTCLATIVGYSGVNASLIGVQQTITVYVGLVEPFGLMALIDQLMPSGGIDEIGFDISSLNFPTMSFKADIVLANATINVDIVGNGIELNETELYNATTAKSINNYGLKATISYEPTTKFPNPVTKTFETSSSDNNVKSLLYFKDLGASENVIVNGKNGMAANGDQDYVISLCGMIIKKHVKFETLQDVEVVYLKNFYVGDSVNAGGLSDSFNIKGVYKRGTADTSDDIAVTLKVSSMNKQIMLNGMEMIGTEDPIGTAKELLATGFMKYQIKFGKDYVCDVNIPVLPRATATVKDVSFAGTAAVGKVSVNFTGAGAITAGDNLNAILRLTFYKDSNILNPIAYENLTVEFFGLGADNAFALPTSAKTLEFLFTVKGLPAGTTGARIVAEVIYTSMGRTFTVATSATKTGTYLSRGERVNYWDNLKIGNSLNGGILELVVNGTAFLFGGNVGSQKFGEYTATVTVYDADGVVIANPYTGNQITAENAAKVTVSVTVGGVVYSISTPITPVTPPVA